MRTCFSYFFSYGNAIHLYILYGFVIVHLKLTIYIITFCLLLQVLRWYEIILGEKRVSCLWSNIGSLYLASLLLFNFYVLFNFVHRSDLSLLLILYPYLQYIPRNMHTIFALLCFVVVIHWLIFPYPSGLLHWHCGNLTIAPVPAKQPWWIWINTSCEFIMNDCITTTKQSTTKPCAYFLGYTVLTSEKSRYNVL